MYSGKHNVADNSRKPSPALWQGINLLELIDDPGVGYFIHEDFMSFGGLVASNVKYWNGWKTFEDTSSTLIGLNTEVGGVISLSTDTTDNADVSIEAGEGNYGPFMPTLGSGPLLVFEARIRVNQIVTQDLFIGLAEKGLAANDGLISDAGAFGDKSYLGFRVQEAASSTLSAVSRKNGGSGELAVGTAQTLVAATWYKVGFIFNPKNVDNKQMRYFVNGAEVQYTAAPVTAYFPTAKALTVLAKIKNGAGAASSMDIDWIRAIQLDSTAAF